MGYNNVLFNGKSMRNAIITKLSEDKHLTSALFANSNITILIDIISYMYQCLLSNLRQAASESMWSDTIFFENATRLAKLIGYYAKGQMPYTMLAKTTNNGAPPNLEFGKVSFGYGPYQYDFSVVEQNVNNDQKIIRLALGDWTIHSENLMSDGTKFQEFIIQKNIGNSEMPAFISQKYVRVFTTNENINEWGFKEILDNLKTDKVQEWTYTSNPLFILQNPEYKNLNADLGNANYSRTAIANSTKNITRLFNFYINENGDYVLKFGDGLGTDIPKLGSKIIVCYILATETDKSITPTIRKAISNAAESVIKLPSDGSGTEPNVQTTCIPVTVLSGYKGLDTAESIRINSANAFNRQNRLVTKEDFRNFVLESYPEWKDVAVQNNWEYISSFYGWLYSIVKNYPGLEVDQIINTNNLEKFNSSDLADANNVYIWVLEKDTIASTQANTTEQKTHVGIMNDMETGTSKTSFGNSIGAIKTITTCPIFLYAICKRFIPFAKSGKDAEQYVSYSSNPFDEKKMSKFRIHVDSNYSQHLNIIKSKTYAYIKSYLFDNIMLGKTPNISALIKDLMGIDGIINITTIFNTRNDASVDFDIETEVEVNGMKFCTWTDMANEVIDNPAYDSQVTFNLPNIPCFQYFECAVTFEEFINNFLEFKIDYSIRA